MSGDEGIVNKVAQSGLINLDLQSLRPNGVRHFIDIKEQLWQVRKEIGDTDEAYPEVAEALKLAP